MQITVILTLFALKCLVLTSEVSAPGAMPEAPRVWEAGTPEVSRSSERTLLLSSGALAGPAFTAQGPDDTAGQEPLRVMASPGPPRASTLPQNS